MALIPLNTFKTKTAVLNTASYDKAKCARDTGLVLDSIAFDLLYSGTTQTTFAGLQYWAQGETKIPAEMPQTLAALDYARQITVQLVSGEYVTPNQNLETQVTPDPGSLGNEAAISQIISEFSRVSNIIEYGTAGTTDTIEPNGELVTDQGIINAATIIQNNKAFIQKQVVTYVNDTFVNKGLDVSAWTQENASLTPGQLDPNATNTAYSVTTTSVGLIPPGISRTFIVNANTTYTVTVYLKDAVVDLWYGDYISEHITSINSGSNWAKYTISWTAGSSGTETIYIGTTDGTNPATGTFEIWEPKVVAGDSTNDISTFNYNKDKCKRDTQLIVESLAFDILFAGSTQSEFSGLQYWKNTTDPASIVHGSINEKDQTIDAISYLRDIVVSIITNQLITVSDGNNSIQYVNATASGNMASVDSVTNNINEIITILAPLGVPLTPEEITNAIVPNSYLTTDSGILNAYNLLQTNKQFIQEEIVAYINVLVLNATQSGDGSIWDGFSYNSELCYRDVGYIIDCISFDLIYGGNRQSIQAGVYYYGFDPNNSTTPAFANEASLSVSAYNYMKSLLSSILTGQKIPVTYQTEVDQVILTVSASESQATSAEQKVDIITSVIENGPSILGSISRKPISLTASTDANDVHAYELLLANKNFLATEVVAYVDNVTTNPFYFPDFKQTLCERDTGFMVDCLTFDLLHGGNRQMTQAGVYYYSSNADVTIIPFEKQATLDAYGSADVTNTSLRTLLPNIVETVLITKSTLPSLLQDDILQITNLPAITNVATTGLQITYITTSGVATITSGEYVQGQMIIVSGTLGGTSSGFGAGTYYVMATTQGTSVTLSSSYANAFAQVPISVSSSGTVTGSTVTKGSTYNIVLSAISDKITAMNNIISNGPSAARGFVKTFGTPISTQGFTDGVYTNIPLILQSGPAPLDFPVVDITVTNGSVTKVVSSAGTNGYVLGGREVQPSTTFKVSAANIAVLGGSISDNFRVSPATNGLSPYPITLTPSTDENAIKAYNLIMANKPFIVAEIVKHMDIQVTKTTRIYTAPPGVTAIILMAMAANVTQEDLLITFCHYRYTPVFSDPSTLNGYQAGDTTTELVKNFDIPPNDSASLINGKMIIESGDSIVAYANKTGGLKVTLSILETANA